MIDTAIPLFSIWQNTQPKPKDSQSCQNYLLDSRPTLCDNIIMMNEEVKPTLSLDLAQATLKEYTERPPVTSADHYWLNLAKYVIHHAKKEPSEHSIPEVK
jgi:hypothetical protein